MFHLQRTQIAAVKSSLEEGCCRYLRTSRPVQKTVGVESDEYQYLEKSVLSTMHFQKSLPRLPIPKLEESCIRYLSGIYPIVSQHQFSLTEKIVAQFRDHDGKNLQKELLAMDQRNKHTSYISEPWFDMYLKYRGSICINHNPFLAFAFEPQSAYNDQLIRTSNMVISALRFKRALDADRLAPEVYHLNPKNAESNLYKAVCRSLPSAVSWYGSYLFKSFPLDMSQYQNLFNSSRIPALQKDRIVRNPTSKHILVLRKGHLYAVNVLSSSGSIVAPSIIHSALAKVLTDNVSDAEFPIAVLTGEERDVWANARIALVAAGNESQLNTIDSALFAVCLDDFNSVEPLLLSKSLLHGDGSNRWFDKSFQLIVQKSGLAALNFEHSWGDGVAVLRFMEEVYKDSQHHWIGPSDKAAPLLDEAAVTEINVTLSDEVKSALTAAKQKFQRSCDNVDFAIMEYTKLTKDDIKKQKISPDAFMQLAIQLAYFRLHNQTVATYESCSTAAFKHGRTETVRPATNETKRLVAMLARTEREDRPNVKLLMDQIRACSDRHSLLVKEAAMGKGFDRHLFALKHLSEQSGAQLPTLYQDESYAIANKIILSTSTLSTETVLLAGFGPVNSDCYGIGYSVGDKRLGAIVSTFKNGQTNGTEFIKALSASLDDLTDILLDSTKRSQENRC